MALGQGGEEGGAYRADVRRAEVGSVQCSGLGGAGGPGSYFICFVKVNPVCVCVCVSLSVPGQGRVPVSHHGEHVSVWVHLQLGLEWMLTVYECDRVSSSVGCVWELTSLFEVLWLLPGRNS